MGKVTNASGNNVQYRGNREEWSQGSWEDEDFAEDVLSNGLQQLQAKAQRGKDLAVQGMKEISHANPNPPPPNKPSPATGHSYPAVQSANLEMSMGVSKPAVRNDRIIVAYGANVTGETPEGRQYEEGYAYWLAIGRGMAPRPYLQLSLDELQNEGLA